MIRLKLTNAKYYLDEVDIFIPMQHLYSYEVSGKVSFAYLYCFVKVMVNYFLFF
jgi:hypothetical protein